MHLFILTFHDIVLTWKSFVVYSYICSIEAIHQWYSRQQRAVLNSPPYQNSWDSCIEIWIFMMSMHIFIKIDSVVKVSYCNNCHAKLWLITASIGKPINMRIFKKHWCAFIVFRRIPYSSIPHHIAIIQCFGIHTCLHPVWVFHGSYLAGVHIHTDIHILFVPCGYSSGKDGHTGERYNME